MCISQDIHCFFGLFLAVGKIFCVVLRLFHFNVHCSRLTSLLYLFWIRVCCPLFSYSYTAHYLTLILLTSYVIEEQPLSYWCKQHSHVNFSHELYYTVKFWKWDPQNMPPPILKPKKSSSGPWYSFFKKLSSLLCS